MKAIIPAAGLGTRFLPATKVVPKEMLPVGNVPALQLIVDEAKRAGAEMVLIVISHAKELIRTYFKDDPAVVFAYQEAQRGLGHAVLQALSHPAFAADMRADPVLVLLGDALVVGCDAASEMVEVSRAHGGASVIGCERVPRELVSRYGVVSPASDAQGLGLRLADIVEKPSIEEAPSDLVVAGRYLLDPAIFSLLRTQTPGKGGEIQLTDAIRRLMSDRPVFGYVYPGARQDLGNPDGYFKALCAFREMQEKGVKG